MAIETVDEIVTSLASNFSRILFDKASITTVAVGQTVSLWRGVGQPGQGAIPTTPAVCNNDLLGAINFSQQTAPVKSYASYLNAACSNSATTLEIHDRLAHMGGLSGLSILSQTVNLDLNAYSSDNIVERIGNPNYSDVQWWMEWYADTGTTTVTATINVTYNDGTSGDLNSLNLPQPVRASRMFGVNALIPAAASGKYIRDINSVTLSGSTLTIGNFGFTATKQVTSLPINTGNKNEVFDWALLGFPEIQNGSCLSVIQFVNSGTTGSVRVLGKISHG
jgi:hypothetical protein